MVTGAIDALRLPEYTGENRCIPCTAVNSLIATVLAVLAGLGAPLGPAGSTAVGVICLVLFGAAIYVRGYLIPGTPQLTKTYVPNSVLRLFDKERSQTSPADLDIEELLVETGAVTDCEDANDLCLTEEFRTGWRDGIAELRTDDTTQTDLARVLDAAPDRLVLREHWEDEAFVALLDDVKVGQWESRAALLADVAAANKLSSRYHGWADLDVEHRSEILSGLRVFIDRCPACDGFVHLREELVQSCCLSVEVAAVTCEDCCARLFESEMQAAADG